MIKIKNSAHMNICDSAFIQPGLLEMINLITNKKNVACI